MTKKMVPHALKFTVVAACAFLAACGGGGGGDGGGGSEGRYQVITFKYPGGGTLLTAPTTLSGTATSGLPISFRTGTPTTCTVAGDQLTLVAAGECLVIASQPGGVGSDGTKWAAADDASQLFNVLKHAQVVDFTPPDYVLSAATKSVELSATAQSGQPVTFETSTPDVCAITGTTLQLKGKGSCAVMAKQAGTDQYDAATAQRFVAIDPLVIADGFAPSGTVKGSTDSIKTKQNGNVRVSSWNFGFAGWEWCDANADGNWCYSTVSDDGSTLTSGFSTPDNRGIGWYAPINRIDIFSPGLSGFNGSGDTTQGLQVTTEKALGFKLGVNATLLRNAKPIVVHLDLGKRSVPENCNVQLSALVYPSSLSNGYAIALSDFTVTNNCKLNGINQASLDAVRALPNPNGDPGASAADVAKALKAYQDAVAALPGRDSAAALLKTSTVVRTRFWLVDGNKTFYDEGTKNYSSDLTLKGAITIQ